MSIWYKANVSGEQGLIIEEETGKNIAVCYDKKDANLIASAPELLEACKLMLTEHQRINEQFKQSKEFLTPGMALARQAITKAEGK